MKTAGSTGPQYQRLPQELSTQVTDEACVQQAKASRCPKLSRYKTVAVVFVVVLAVVLIGITCLQWRQPYLATCLQATPSDQVLAKENRKEGRGTAHLRCVLWFLKFFIHI